jgi:integrase
MAKKSPLIGKNIQRRSADVAWLYRFYCDGQNYNGETHTTDRKEAEALAAARKAEVVSQAKKNTELGLSAMTFADAADAWWNEAGRHNVERGLRAQVDWLVTAVGAKTRLSDIREPLVTRIRELRRDTVRTCAVNGTRPVTANTVNHTLTTFRTIVNYAHLHRGAAVAPIAWAKIMLDLPAHEIRVLSEEELRQIIALMRPDMHDALAFALASAKRIDEILSLTWGQIDWNVDHPTMRLRVKGDKPVIDPLGSTELAILRRQQSHQANPAKTDRVFTHVAQRTRDYFNRITGEKVKSQVAGRRYPLTYGLLSGELERVAKELGLEGVSIHVLRHTAATMMLRAGVPIEDVSRALNHASIDITLRHYAKVTNVEVRSAKEAIAKKVAANLQQGTTPLLQLVAPQQ